MTLRAVIIILTLALPMAGLAEDKKKFSEDPGDKNAPLKVVSDEMETDNKTNTMVFKGTVIATKGKLKVESDKMTVWTDEEQSDVEKIIAIGNVTITKGPKIATGKKARYYAEGKKLVLTGDPVLRDGKSTAKGKRVIYFFDREDMVIVGDKNTRSSIELYPKKKNDKKDSGSKKKK